MTKYIYSTLATNMDYTFYSENGKEIVKKIRIFGGSGVTNKQWVTPQGLLTKISDADFEMLKSHRIFQLHLTNGFITVESSKVDVEEVFPNLSHEDKSRPLTRRDWNEGGRIWLEQKKQNENMGANLAAA